MGSNFPTSLLTTTLRGVSGINSQPRDEQPAHLPRLYDIENCPYCRLVREAITELDLDVLILPCPKGGERFRPQVVEAGGKAQFPYLLDLNTGKALYESMDIVAYLYEEYGKGGLPLKWRVGPLQKLGSSLASAPRSTRPQRARTGKLPGELLELYSFEGSPYARPVREVLGALEIPYILRSCGRSDWRDWLLPGVRNALGIVSEGKVANRRLLQQEHGKVSIPFLFDPNTEEALFESERIIAHLQAHYGT